MQVVIYQEDKITLNTFLQLIINETGIGLYQNSTEVFKVSWEAIDNARKMLKIK